MTKRLRDLRIAGLLIGLFYGLLARLAFGHIAIGDRAFAVMSSSFIIGVPIALGFLTVWFTKFEGGRSPWLRAIFSPWSSAIAFLVGSLLLAWEGLICIFLWLPLVLILSSVGGLIALLGMKAFKRDSSRNLCVGLVALLPFVSASIESLRVESADIRKVENSIEIRGTPSRVWKQIVTVPRIQRSEQSRTFVHILGFPEPVEAVLIGSGVGSVRMARFEGNVLFEENVSIWEPDRRLGFEIHADTKNIPPTTFDEHVTIGGRYFDVLRGEYRIEPEPNGCVILHLSSEQRLSTNFNFYSHLWTEAIMSNLQQYILGIIKHRVELEASTSSNE